MSFNHKRKGSEMLVSPGPAVNHHHHHPGYQQQTQQQVVVVSPTNSSWEDVQAKMKELYQSLVEEETKDNSNEYNDNDNKNTDTVLAAIRNVVHEKHLVDQAFISMEQEAARIQQELIVKVEQAKTKCQLESEQAYQLQKKVTELSAARDVMVAELQDTLQATNNVQASIIQQEHNVTQQLEMCQHETSRRKKMAARLQHQISLYARITGIKWDFDQQVILAGHVAVPSQEAFRPFSIDPKELSKFEVAHKLWDLMDGKDV